MKTTFIGTFDAGYKTDTPFVRLQAKWVRDIGFEEGKRYWIEHNSERILIRLDDGTIQQKARNKPYRTPRNVSVVRLWGNYWQPRIDLKGLWMEEIGFKIGGKALVQYDYGIIMVRPLFMEDALVERVTQCTTTTRVLPKIRLTGTWLDACGFTPNKMALLEHEYGSISLQLRGEGQADYLRLAKSILKHRKGSIVYVTSVIPRKSKSPLTVIELEDKWLATQGFVVGVPILVTAEQGSIAITLLDCDAATKRATP